MICDRIKSLRQDKDWTQQYVATLLFISRSTYSAYENGANAAPLEILVKLAILHNTSTDYLLNITDVMAPYPRKKQ